MGETNNMNILENIKAELAAFEAKRKELVSELRKEFPALLKPLFDKYPEIETVAWSQYTPYFNDGEECIFQVNNDSSSIEINGHDYYHESIYQDPEQKGKFEEFGKILQSIPEDFYKDLFGDHAEITVHCNGSIEAEEYDHD